MCYAQTRPLIRQLIITTLMLTLAMIYVRHLPVIMALAFCLVFGFVDSLFFGASLSKIPTGVRCAWSFATDPSGVRSACDCRSPHRALRILVRRASSL